MLISKTGFMFAAAEWRALLSHASADECRPNLHAIALDPAAGSVVTTDGHRMMVASTEPGPDAPAWSKPRVIPFGVCDAAAKAAGARGAIVVVPEGDGFVLYAVKDRQLAAMIEPEIRAGQPFPADSPTVAAGCATFRAAPSDTTFVPWRHVLRSSNPAPDTSTPIALNPRYVADAAAALAAIADDANRTAAETEARAAKAARRKPASVFRPYPISIWPATGQGLDPLAIGLVVGSVVWRVVVMPMRAEQDTHAPVALPHGAPAWDVTAARAAGTAPAPAKPASTGGAAVIPMGRKSRSRAG